VGEWERGRVGEWERGRVGEEKLIMVIDRT
jgi:hypothetical protein